MPDVSEPLHRALGLTDDEAEQIDSILGRQANGLELAMYSVMWSEHCSYKSSRIHLKRLPTEAPWVLVGPGENAGVVDVGDGIAAAIRIESHNHPSAIEPYQGAATGVGGINRDIFTMGARPIAQLNSLRFGNPNHPKTRWLMRGVVKGIGDYGNAFGIPTVGGEVFFDDSFQINPLVNAMSAGIGRIEIKSPFLDSTQLPIYYSVFHYFLAGLVALLASGIAGYFPARKAASVQPVDIIRGAS